MSRKSKRRLVSCIVMWLVFVFSSSIRFFTTDGVIKRQSLQLYSMTFETCGGLSNQALSISYAATFAVVSNVKHLILPPMALDGRQIRGVDMFQNSSTPDAFGQLFDRWHFSTVLRGFGIQVHDISSFSGSNDFLVRTCFHGRGVHECMKVAQLCSRTQKCQLHMQCPFLHKIWDVPFLKENNQLFDVIFNGLTLSRTLSEDFNQAFSKFKIVHNVTCLTFVHARIERDWHQHCKDWSPDVPPDYDYNCLVTLKSIVFTLNDLNLTRCPIYLAYDTYDVDPDTRVYISQLKQENRVFDWSDFEFRRDTEREHRAVMQLFMGMQADYFLGNSVSTLSALVIRARRQTGKWSAQYNRGFIPLSEFVPGFRLPWVFTLSRSQDKNYDTLMKVAVMSARAKTTLIPICVAHEDEGSNSSRIRWLIQQGVVVEYHRPSWDNDLTAALSDTDDRDKHSSHLYGDLDMVLSTFLRLDIPQVSYIWQFENILYTDTDVFFRRDVTNLKQLGSRITDSIQLGYEAQERFPLNAGVYMASVPFLRRTHDDLIQEMKKSKGIYYRGYGPGDQGLINKVYEAQLRQQGALNQELNAKPYHKFAPNSAIVHFHGPKPSDYNDQLLLHRCRFNKMCSRGLRKGVCAYFLEWISYVELRDRPKYDPLRQTCVNRARSSTWFLL